MGISAGIPPWGSGQVTNPGDQRGTGPFQVVAWERPDVRVQTGASQWVEAVLGTAAP